jgi:hypothetical protein
MMMLIRHSYLLKDFDEALAACLASAPSEQPCIYRWTRQGGGGMEEATRQRARAVSVYTGWKGTARRRALLPLGLWLARDRPIKVRGIGVGLWEGDGNQPEGRCGQAGMIRLLHPMEIVSFDFLQITFDYLFY